MGIMRKLVVKGQTSKPREYLRTCSKCERFIMTSTKSSKAVCIECCREDWGVRHCGHTGVYIDG